VHVGYAWRSPDASVGADAHGVHLQRRARRHPLWEPPANRRHGGWRGAVTPTIRRFGFDAARGAAWLRHNIEAVGLFEHFLPALYRQETGLPD
jgi:IS5 family transposase